MAEIVVSLLLMAILLTWYQYCKRKKKIEAKLKKLKKNEELIKARARWK